MDPAACERRHFERRAVCFPLQIDTSDKPQRFGVTRNVSASGLLLGTRSRYQLGQRVQLTFRVMPDAIEWNVRGKVVRMGLEERTARYPRRVAIEFDAPEVHLDDELVGAAEVQAELYGK